MAGGARIHGYGLEMAVRLEELGAGTEELSWQGSWQCRSLIEVILHVGGDVLDGQHGLFACGLDLRLGQQEAITTSVTQLKGVGIFHSLVVGPVVRASSSRVWGQKMREGLFLERGTLMTWDSLDMFSYKKHAFRGQEII